MSNNSDLDRAGFLGFLGILAGIVTAVSTFAWKLRTTPRPFTPRNMLRIVGQTIFAAIVAVPTTIIAVAKLDKKTFR